MESQPVLYEVRIGHRGCPGEVSLHQLCHPAGEILGIAGVEAMAKGEGWSFLA